MAPTLTRLTALKQRSLFKSRSRVRSLHTIVSDLFITQNIENDQDDIDVGNFSINSTFTISMRVARAAGASGLLFELGDGTTGIAAYVDDVTLGFVAGNAGDDGASLAEDVLLEDTAQDLVFAVNPGKGLVAMWVDGRLVGKALAVNGAFPDGWAADSSGAIGNKNGTASSRLPGGTDGPLTDASLIGDVKIYAKQFPRVPL